MTALHFLFFLHTQCIFLINPIQSQQQNQQQTKSPEKQEGSTENSKILKYSVRTSVYTLKFENNKWYVGDNSDTNYKKINKFKLTF